MVPGEGFEPSRYRYRGILSPLCLPFHHPGRAEQTRAYRRRAVSRDAGSKSQAHRSMQHDSDPVGVVRGGRHEMHTPDVGDGQVQVYQHPGRQWSA